jgi:hypothetical protein
MVSKTSIVEIVNLDSQAKREDAWKGLWGVLTSHVAECLRIRYGFAKQQFEDLVAVR